MVYHLLTEHTVFEASGTYKLPFVPANLMLAMFITKAEEALVGIETAVTASSQDELGFPGSSDIGGSEYGGTQLLVRPTEKRGQSETMSSAGVGKKRPREDRLDELETNSDFHLRQRRICRATYV